jgi:hypothetical protein
VDVVADDEEAGWKGSGPFVCIVIIREEAAPAAALLLLWLASYCGTMISDDAADHIETKSFCINHDDQSHNNASQRCSSSVALSY